MTATDRVRGRKLAHLIAWARTEGYIPEGEEPPVAGGPPMGAAVGTDADWPRLRTLVGPMQSRRLFSPGGVSFAKVAPSIAAGEDVCYSFKYHPTEITNGSKDIEIGAFVGQVRDALAPGQHFASVFYHEPEDNIEDGLFTAPQFRAASAHHAQLVVAGRGSALIDPEYVEMHWTHDPRSGRNPDNYFDQAMWDAGIRTVGVDAYQARPTGPLGKGAPRWVKQWREQGGSWETWDSLADLFTPWVQARGLGVRIAEYGHPEDPNDPDRKQRWLADAHAWAVDVGCKAMLYYDYVLGISDGPDYLLNSSPQVTAEFARQVTLAG